MKQLRDAEIHLLRVFAQVVEAGGLSAAQERLNVAPSTISTQISSLEERLGFRICLRGRAGFSLTPKGKIVLKEAQKLFSGLDRFQGEMLGIADTYVGVTRIGLLDSIAHNPNLHLSSAINTFRNENSRHQFAIHLITPGEFEVAILDGIIDLAIGWTGYQLPSLRYLPLFKETQTIYCERRHPLFEQTEIIEPSALERQDWVRRAYSMPTSLPFYKPPISTASATHMEAVAHLIISGLYVGYLPQHYAQPWVDENRLRAILPKEMSYDVEFSLILKHSQLQNTALKRLTEILLALH
jgi:DNA-binding transcriptional LysR family regulator